MALLSCPNCGARGVGKVGTGQFYCWECCVEFRAGKKGWTIYQVQDDGSLLAVEPGGCEPAGLEPRGLGGSPAGAAQPGAADAPLRGAGSARARAAQVQA